MTPSKDTNMLYTLRDFAEYIGLFPLTGERCQIGMRMLCDVIHPDIFVPLFKEYFDLPGEVAFADPWNSSGKHSVMLGKDVIVELAVFYAARSGKYVLRIGDYTHLLDSKAELEQHRCHGARVLACPAEKANNRHAFTGRD